MPLFMSKEKEREYGIYERKEKKYIIEVDVETGRCDIGRDYHCRKVASEYEKENAAISPQKDWLYVVGCWVVERQECV